MTNRTIEYPLDNGFVHHWLLAGPQSMPVNESTVSDWRVEAAGKWYEPELILPQAPVDRDEFRDALKWYYVRCQVDHLVDASVYAPVRSYVQAWAYTRLKVANPAEAFFTLSVNGPSDVWLNGQQVYRVESFSPDGLPQVIRFPVELKVENEIIIRFHQAGVRSIPLAFSLSLDGISSKMTIQIPVQARFPHRVAKYEQLFDQAYLEEAVSYRGRVVNLRFAENTQSELRYQYSIQDSDSNFYVDGTWDVEPDKPLDIGHPQRIFERQAFAVLRAPGKEYYEQELRYERRMPFYILDNGYTQEPYGDYGIRRIEGLEDAADEFRREGNLFSEIARMALGRWDKVDVKSINTALEKVTRRVAGSEMLLVGLLGMANRYENAVGFPKSVLEPLALSALNYGYTASPDLAGVDFESESSALLLLTAEILAGQRYPDRVFQVSGQKGSDHQAHAEAGLQEWLHLHGQYGFAEWDSPAAIEKNLVALAHLVGMSNDEVLRDFSAVMMDKILFLMAANSFQGILGGSQGKGSAAHFSAGIKSGLLQETAGIARLLWGMGVFSEMTAGFVSLALSEYEFPTFFADIAAARPEALWSSERHVANGVEINKVIYKTPDYLLGSVQDYRPGCLGNGEHVWQATMSPTAVVFTNHPSACRQDESRQPGFWLGNGALPRVAQWKDALIAIYNIPENNGLDFTHAYFPVSAFDEYTIEGGWIFARKEQAYIALTAANGLEQIKQAPDGYHEIRSQGRKNIWICQMGRVETDGSFIQFREKVLHLAVKYQDLQVEFTTLHDETLSFGWQSEFQSNGKGLPLSGVRHIDHPNCKADLPAKEIDIEWEDYLLKLNFE